VRSNFKTIGFLDNPQRINVAMSRAKKGLIVIGNEKSLENGTSFREIFELIENDHVK
jgi:superfamily I DNA and/or RNA helicase